MFPEQNMLTTCSGGGGEIEASQFSQNFSPPLLAERSNPLGTAQ